MCTGLCSIELHACAHSLDGVVLGGAALLCEVSSRATGRCDLSVILLNQKFDSEPKQTKIIPCKKQTIRRIDLRKGEKK